MKNLHIIPGVSGSGKTTIGRAMEQRLRASLVVPYTTREPREGEVDGHDYHFRDMDDFTGRMRNNDGGWTYTRVGENYYYNSTPETLPNDDNPTRILPVSFAALQSVIDDYSPFIQDGIITVIPTAISPTIASEWLRRLQPLRPTRNLQRELDEQNEYLESFAFDEIFYPTWDIEADATSYIAIYRAIIKTRKAVQ